MDEKQDHVRGPAAASVTLVQYGDFWQMHDLLLDHQGELDVTALSTYAGDLGLDQKRSTTI